ncbi:hypothetical protein JTB14_016760 [Gonioctena quinquepunctata]|nr:hypothetical protein JTB14_016760 [Gonioctena quinquepunctata]
MGSIGNTEFLVGYKLVTKSELKSIQRAIRDNGEFKSYYEKEEGSAQTDKNSGKMETSESQNKNGKMKEPNVEDRS